MTHPDTLILPRAVVEQLHARLLSGEFYDDYDSDMALVGALRAALQPQAAALTACNCRWDGETQVQSCTLHAAHVDAIHEWAERAKDAEAKLAAQAAGEPVAWKHDCDALCVNNLRLWVDRCPHCGKPRTETTPPATQAALTAALSDCRTCQHLSEAWGVCEARPKCVGGEQYVYFPEKQLWDKTPRNDGQAAHQEMREALYAEFNRAVGRQHD